MTWRTKMVRSRWRTILMAITTTLVLLPALTGCATPTAPAQPNRQQRTIGVSGSGTVSAQPDVATLRLGVQTEAEDADAALSQNSAQMEDVISALEEAGVAAENIQTQAVQLRPRYDEEAREAKEEQAVVGYVASNIVEVRVEELDALGELIDEAVQAGGNRVEGIRFEVSDAAQLLEQARETAWEDAQAKAEQLANLADAELGEVLTINETSRRPRPVEEEVLEAGGQAVPIEPGSQEIQVDLQVTWLLE